MMAGACRVHGCSGMISWNQAVFRPRIQGRPVDGGTDHDFCWLAGCLLYEDIDLSQPLMDNLCLLDVDWVLQVPVEACCLVFLQGLQTVYVLTKRRCIQCSTWTTNQQDIHLLILNIVSLWIWFACTTHNILAHASVTPRFNLLVRFFSVINLYGPDLVKHHARLTCSLTTCQWHPLLVTLWFWSPSLNVAVFKEQLAGIAGVALCC